jgi:hypothetical protein
MKKASLLILAIFLLFTVSIIAQSGFSYKRQLSYNQCVHCGCKKSKTK